MWDSGNRYTNNSYQQPAPSDPYAHHHHPPQSYQQPLPVPAPIPSSTQSSTHHQSFLNTYLGLGVFKDGTGGAGGAREAPPVPQGFEVRISKKGTPYFAPIAESADDIAAQNEHVREKVSVFCGSGELLERFGPNIWMYFDFLKYLCLVNLFLTGLSLVSWAPFAVSREGKAQAGLEVLYVAGYPARLYSVWLAAGIVAVLLWFSLGPLYAVRVLRWYRTRGADEVDHDSFVGTDVDLIMDNAHVSVHSRSVRLLVSYTLFLIAVGCSGVSTYLLANAKWGSNKYVAPILSALVVTLINYGWKMLTVTLTDFEKHRTWSTYRQHNTIKFFSFKMVNVIILYIANEIARTRKSPSGAAGPCILQATGSQFFWLVILDITFFNLIEIVSPLAYSWLCPVKDKGDDDARPEFDLAEEYLELLARQFVILLGSTIFPLITALGFVANVLEFYLDRFRLIKICKKTHLGTQQTSLRSFLVFFLFCISACAMASWPNGAAWVLSSTSSRAGYQNCPLVAEQ